MKPSNPAREALPVHLALVGVQVMFASMVVTAKSLYSYLDPLGVAAARTGFGALVFWLVVVLWRRYQPLRGRGHAARLALFGLLGVTVNQVFFLLGLHYSTAVNASLLVTTIPIFAVFLEVVLRRTSVSGARLAGMAVAFAGVAVVVGADRFDLSSRLFLGNAMIVLNAFSYALFLVLSRPLLEVYSPLTLTAWIFLFGSLINVPLGFGTFLDGVPQMSAGAWGLLIYILVVPTVGAYFLNSWCLKRVPASVVALYIYLQPVTAAALACVFLAERITGHHVLGALAIFAGMYLAHRRV